MGQAAAAMNKTISQPSEVQAEDLRLPTNEEVSRVVDDTSFPVANSTIAAQDDAVLDVTDDVAAAAAEVAAREPSLIDSTHATSQQHHGHGKSIAKGPTGRRPVASSASTKKRRSSLKSSQQQQQRRGSGTSATSTTAPAAATTGNRPVLKRRQSSGLRQQQQHQPQQRSKITLTVESDHYPKRLINPLTEWPPSVYDTVAPSRANAMSATAAATNSAPGNSGTAAAPQENIMDAEEAGAAADADDMDTVVTVAPALPTPRGAYPPRASDFLPLLDLWYSRPDTYSIRFMAQLLGLSVPESIPVLNDDNNRDGILNNVTVDSTMFSPLQQPETKSGVLMHNVIPPQGNFCTTIWKKRETDNSNDDEDEDLRNLSHVDPTYALLTRENHPHDNTLLFSPVSLLQYQKLTPLLADLHRKSTDFMTLAMACGCWYDDGTDPHSGQDSKSRVQPTTNTAHRSLGWAVTKTTTPESTAPTIIAAGGAGITYRMEWFSCPVQQRAELIMRWTSLRDEWGREYLTTTAEQGNSNFMMPPPPQLLDSQQDANSINPPSGGATNWAYTETTEATTGAFTSMDSTSKERNPSLESPPDAFEREERPGTTDHSHSSNPPAVPLPQESVNAPPPSRGDKPQVMASTLDMKSPPVDDSNSASQQQTRLDDRSHFILTNQPVPEGLFVFLVALSLEHARACGVIYALLQVPASMKLFFQTYFRMVVRLPYEGIGGPTDQRSSSSCTMVCDLQKCSYRFAFLTFQARQGGGSCTSFTPPFAAVNERSANKMGSVTGRAQDSNGPAPPQNTTSSRQRWLVRLPSHQEVSSALRNTNVTASPIAVDRSKRASFKKPDRFLTGASGTTRNVAIHFRAKLLSPDVVECRYLSNNVEGPLMKIPECSTTELPSLDILRSFALPVAATSSQAVDKEDSEILHELTSKQKELNELETRLLPCVQSLLTNVIRERAEYEGDKESRKREHERHVLAENIKMLQRRKEQDLAFQKQLEQDMDAVCEICLDGEVTPDNQILFCESCNVAVHQICYGIEKVPEGDYYCLPCKRLGRDRLAGVSEGGGLKLARTPLPISCELCPLKPGAFVQTDMKPREGDKLGKWIHVVCAKWQGLSFVNSRRTDMIEDVTELKIHFRQHKISCCLCRGERGSMNKCRVDECKQYVHVTCARAAGTCEVIHGENAKGSVETNPWTLMCPEHSKIKPEDVPQGATPVEKLILFAKEFPPEPKPPPIEVVPKPFNTVGGEEREHLLQNEAYEQALLLELTTKKMYGFRCEVCDVCEEDGRNLLRCSGCGAVCCVTCVLQQDMKDGNFKCAGCRFVDQKKKSNELYETPYCLVCYQRNGLLREGVATPVSKKSHWHSSPKEFKKSYFGKPIWVHPLCTFWHEKLKLDHDTGQVDCSNVVMSNGRSLILPNTRCYLCGWAGGLKAKCDHESCSLCRKGDEQACFHVTCARQAGLEVNCVEEGRRMRFYVRCYRHCGNEYNFRAKLEDLIEIERRRAGKILAKAHLPMKFAHAQRLLNSAIVVMKMLGFAWRWAEWWVDYDSSWEPLLEPDQKESEMTKEELKIVDSTRESRCEDARKCRLAAFGAAVRERVYDTEEGFDRESLDRALRAILSTKSLAGPLEEFEVDFLVDWLGRAYRSRSRLLGFGEDKIEICRNEGLFCRHIVDGTPKYTLGERPAPGKQHLAYGDIFESGIQDVDDFLKKEPLTDEMNRRRSRAGRSDVNSQQEPVSESPRKKQSPRATKPKTPPRSSTKKRDQSRQMTESENRAAAVAALVPSAVKRRKEPRSRESVSDDIEPADQFRTRKRGRPKKSQEPSPRKVGRPRKSEDSVLSIPVQPKLDGPIPHTTSRPRTSEPSIPSEPDWSILEAPIPRKAGRPRTSEAHLPNEPDRPQLEDPVPRKIVRQRKSEEDHPNERDVPELEEPISRKIGRPKKSEERILSEPDLPKLEEPNPREVGSRRPGRPRRYIESDAAEDVPSTFSPATMETRSKDLSRTRQNSANSPSETVTSVKKVARGQTLVDSFQPLVSSTGDRHSTDQEASAVRAVAGTGLDDKAASDASTENVEKSGLAETGKAGQAMDESLSTSATILPAESVPDGHIEVDGKAAYDTDNKKIRKRSGMTVVGDRNYDGTPNKRQRRRETRSYEEEKEDGLPLSDLVAGRRDANDKSQPLVSILFAKGKAESEDRLESPKQRARRLGKAEAVKSLRSKDLMPY